MSSGGVGELIGGAAAAYDILDRNRRENHEAHENRMAASRNADLQREFAQNGVRWKVEDARRAGINPLAALGASTIGASPVHVGEERGPTFGDEGQNLARAISATSTSEERAANALRLKGMQLDIEGKQIDNSIRAQQLNAMSVNNPPFPGNNYLVPGQTQSGAVQVKPSQPTASEAPGVQAGVINDMQYVQHSDGSLGITPSTDAKERNEDDFIAEVMWHARNRLSPPAPTTKSYPLPENLVRQGYKYWLWHPFKQKFVPSKNP